MIRPIQDNVLVLLDHHRDARTETRVGSIIVPHTAVAPPDDAACWATVIAAGPGAYDEKIRHDEGTRDWKPVPASRRYVPMDPAVLPGARVLIDRAIAGDRIPIDGVEHRMVRAEQIVGVAE